MMKKYHILIVLLLVMYTASAQRFPVRIIPTVNPPAPVNFYNYADGTTLNSPLRVQLLLGDLAISNRQIRLKVAFEGNGIRFESTDNVIGAAPLFIDGGTPLLLTNADLAPYFELQNLQGISPRRYGQVIPEGNYQFCFEVFDVARGVQLGERTCASTFIFNNDPPFLNLPVDGANIEPKPVDNIVFQWTPRHINVSNVEYEFSLVEIWDNSVDPQTAFLTSPPIYQVTTRATSLVYGPAQPLLLNNKRYAWQVQAKALRGAEEIGLFRNDGKSEIFWFSKTETCGTPKNISGEPKGLSKMNVFWDEDPNVFSEYTIAYREKDRPNARWFTKRTNAGWATVWDLKPNTTYEYKVKGKCTFQYGAYSNTQELQTAAAEDETANYNCGIVPDEVAITNRQGHPNLLIGDRITAGDFVITLTDITSEANGVISGSGFVRVPYFEFARFGVVFNNILVNTDYQLAEGEIVTLYDPVFGENAELVVDINTNVGKGINGDKGEIKEITLDFVIEKITINEFGAIVVTGTNGEEHIIPGGKDVTIVDKEGTPWTVSENGEITKGESAEGGKATPNNTQGISASGVTQITAKGVRVTFNNSGFYYYDGIPNRVADKLTAVYDYLPINEGGEYAVPYKAISNIPSHENDSITATVTFTDNSSTKKDIIFKTKDGIKVNATWEGNTATLQLQQKFDYAVEDILATVKPKDSTGQYTVAGVFKHVHLAAQELKAIDITLVPVQRNAISANIKAQINAIYNKAGADFNITIDPPLDISKADWNLDGNDTVDVGDSSLLAQYTEEERAIFRYYKSQHTYDSKRYYIFVLGETMLPSKTIEGFMPLGRQYGFVFNPSNLAKTIAHELGHGVFGLQHPWDTYNFEPGQTDWLMDNSSDGTVLNHMDWEQMHAGGIKLYTFQGDEDGESARLKFRPDKKFTVKIDGVDYFQFLTPTGQVLNIEYDNLLEVSFYFGIASDGYELLLPSTLLGFKIKEGNKGVDYKLSFSRLKSDGYKNAKGNYFVPTTNAVKNKNVLVGYTSPMAGEEGFIMAKHNYSDATSFDFNNTNKALLNVSTVNFYPNASNKLYRQFYNDRLLTGSSQQSITTDYRNTIKGHEEGNEFLVVLKIAEWRSRYPFFFDKFTTTFDAWTRGNLKRETRVKGRGEYLGIWNERMGEDLSLFEQYTNASTKIEFYKVFLEEFKNYVYNASNNNRECLENLKANIATITVSEVLNCIERASQDELKLHITQDGRQEVIKLLLSETWVNGASEEAIVKLFQYVPKNFDEEKFFKFFENTCNLSLVGRRQQPVNRCLWSLLFDAVDDSDIVFSGNNRQALMRSILTIFYKSERFKNAWLKGLDPDGAFIKAHTYVFDYKNIFARLVSGKYESLDTSVNSEGLLRVVQINSDNDRNETYKPFDFTQLVNKSLLEKGSVFKKTDANGKPIALPLPAIVLHYISEDAESQTAKDVIITAVDVASLALTGTPTSQLAKLFIYADKVSSIASIAGTAFREDIPKLANLFNTVSLATGVTSLGSFALNTNAIKALTKSDDVKHIEDVLSSIETLKTNDALDVLSQLKKSDTDDGVEAIIELLETKKVTHVDDVVLVERLDNAVKVLRGVGVTNDVIKTVKSIDEAIALLKVEFNFSENIIKEQFLDLFDKSSDVAKLDVAQIEKLKLDGLNYFISKQYDELYNLFKHYKINPWGDVIWPPLEGFSKIIERVKASDYKKAIDRFQDRPSLGGGYGSPVKSGEGIDDLVYTYDSRMLASKLENDAYYFNFYMTEKATDVELTIGDVAPWFNKDARLAGEQIKFSEGLHSIDRSYFKNVKVEQKVLGEFRKCVVDQSKAEVVVELQKVFNRLPKDISNDIVDYINDSRDILNRFKDAQKADKLEELIEAYKIFRKNGYKTPCK